MGDDDEVVGLDVHVRLVEELPLRLTAAVAAGVLAPVEARDVVRRARLLLQARIAVQATADHSALDDRDSVGFTR